MGFNNAMAYSLDLRTRIIDAVDRGVGSPYGSLSQSGRSTGLPRFATPT